MHGVTMRFIEALELFSLSILILIVLNNERFSLLSALLIIKVKNIPFVLISLPIYEVSFQ